MEKFEKYIQSGINEFEENANLFPQSNKRALWDKISGTNRKKMAINYKLLFYVAASFFILSGSAFVIMHLVYTKNIDQLSSFNEKLLNELSTQKSSYVNEIVALEDDISAKTHYISQLTHDIDSTKTINSSKEGKKDIKRNKSNQSKKKPKKKNNIKIQINNIPFAEQANADTNYIALNKPVEQKEDSLPVINRNPIDETTEKIYVLNESKAENTVKNKKKKFIKIQFGNFKKQVSFSKQQIAGIKTSM